MEYGESGVENAATTKQTNEREKDKSFLELCYIGCLGKSIE